VFVYRRIGLCHLHIYSHWIFARLFERLTVNHPIQPRILAILGQLKFDGNNATIPMQLDRPTYVEVHKVLELAGGKWNKKAKAHVFSDDEAEAVIIDAVAQGHIFDRKKAFQYFPTPDRLADKMCSRADLGTQELTILEPSAGDGAIVRAIRRCDPNSTIDTIEIDEKHRDSLKKSGASIINIGDFMLLPTSLFKDTFNRIIANPPFRNLQDIIHLRRMYDVLAPKGTLVCLTSPSWQFRSTKLCKEFRTWLDGLAHTVEEIESGTFSDTDIRTLLITIKK
jgi:phospholipid N-methyltransferase